MEALLSSLIAHQDIFISQNVFHHALTLLPCEKFQHELQFLCYKQGQAYPKNCGGVTLPNRQNRAINKAIAALCWAMVILRSSGKSSVHSTSLHSPWPQKRFQRGQVILRSLSPNYPVCRISFPSKKRDHWWQEFLAYVATVGFLVRYRHDLEDFCWRQACIPYFSVYSSCPTIAVPFSVNLALAGLIFLTQKCKPPSSKPVSYQRIWSDRQLN